MILKRLIVISVIFALVTGAAFAEVSFGGTVFGKVDLASGSSVEDSEIGVGGGLGRADISANTESGDGTFGGFLRFRAESYGGGASAWGLAWWKPIDQVKIQIGNNPDGLWDTSHMTRWGFYQVAGDIGVVNAGNAWGGGLGPVVSDNVFFGGEGGFGAFLSITPLDLLSINIGIPFANGLAEDVYKKILAQVVLNLDGIGQFNLTYKFGKGYKEGKAGEGGTDATPPTTWYLVSVFTAGVPASPTWLTEAQVEVLDNTDAVYIVHEKKEVGGTPAIPGKGYVEGYDESPGTLYASFYLSMIENLGLDLGLSVNLPTKGEKDNDIVQPLGLGLGVQFGAGQFGIKSRILAALGGKNGDNAIPLELTFDILPSFAITDNLTAFFSAGIGLKALPDDPPEGMQALVNFHINPYVQYKFDWSKGLFAGFLMESRGSYNKDDDALTTWSIPIGLYISF